MIVSRRGFLSLATALPALSQTRFPLSSSDEIFLNDLSRRAFLYFWEQSDPHTGLVLDRARDNGAHIPGRSFGVASTALTGFLLSAFCIGAERRWRDPSQIRERVRACLRHLAANQENVHGWYYHFVDRNTGERAWNCELSSIDTAMLLAGVITAQQFYRQDAEIHQLASNLYQRTDFLWLLDSETGFMRMGWTPEGGFLRAEWTDYWEQAILLVLAIASPTHPIPARCWSLFQRDPIELCGYRFVGSGPIFTHQYSQAWLPLANRRDAPPFEIDYFQNSRAATYALRALCLSRRSIYPSYSANLWGVSPSDSEVGYVAWGSPLSRRNEDGTVVPCAAAGSLMFAPEICLPALRFMYEQFSELIYGRYGFVDAFHPQTLWVDPDVIGIDQGITLLSAENLRTGKVWRWFSRSPDVQRALQSLFEPC